MGIQLANKVVLIICSSGDVGKVVSTTFLNRELK